MIDIEVLISEEVSGVLTAETDDIRDYAVEVCRASNFTQTDINIVFIDDEKMTGLNETFSSQVKNKKSGTTDVLSFNLSEASSGLLEGEVYVSLDRAKVQAKEYHTYFEEEVIRLVTHGLLHLTGRTHDTSESYRAMVDETDNLTGMYWEMKEGGVNEP